MCFLRILQLSLSKEYSIKSIQNELAQFTLEKIRQTNNYQLSTYTPLIAKIQQLYNLEINREIYSGADIVKVIGDIKKIRKNVYFDSEKIK